jgi:hypothetical protein
VQAIATLRGLNPYSAPAFPQFLLLEIELSCVKKVKSNLSAASPLA